MRTKGPWEMEKELISSPWRGFLKLLNLSICAVRGGASQSSGCRQKVGEPRDLKLCRRLKGGAEGELWVCLFYFSVLCQALEANTEHGPLGPSTLGILSRLRFQSIGWTGFRARVCSPTPPSVFLRKHQLVLTCIAVVDSVDLNCSCSLQAFPMNEPENTRQVVNNRFNECAKRATGCTELSG